MEPNSARPERTGEDIPLRSHAICTREANIRAGEWIHRPKRLKNGGESRCCTRKYFDGTQQKDWYHHQDQRGSIYYHNPDGSAYYCWPERDIRWYTDPDPDPSDRSLARMNIVPRELPSEVWKRRHPANEMFYGDRYGDPYEEWMDPEVPDSDLGIARPSWFDYQNYLDSLYEDDDGSMLDLEDYDSEELQAQMLQDPNWTDDTTDTSSYGL